NNLSTFASKHRLGSELRKKENCIELRLDDFVPILRLFVQDTAAQRHIAGIINQDIYATEFAFGLVQRGLQSGAVCHINPHSNRGTTDGFQFGKHPLVLFIVSSQYSDGGPGFGQSERNAATNSPVTASHDSHPAGQVK